MHKTNAFTNRGVKPCVFSTLRHIKIQRETLEKLGRLLVTRIFPEYQRIVMEDGSETIGVYAANV